jgi:hypothetical protein
MGELFSLTAGDESSMICSLVLPAVLMTAIWDAGFCVAGMIADTTARSCVKQSNG